MVPDPSNRVSDTCRIYAEEHWMSSGSWWPNALLLHFMLVLPLFWHLPVFTTSHSVPGGLICRGILSTLPDHNVHSFISLSSPQAGQYGGKCSLEAINLIFVLNSIVWNMVHCHPGSQCLLRSELNRDWSFLLFLFRHKLPEVPLPPVHEVQPVPFLLHLSGPKDIYLQLLERLVGWAEDWAIQGLGTPSTLKVEGFSISNDLCQGVLKESMWMYWWYVVEVFVWLKCLFSLADPHHMDMYVNSSDYLALLNSERTNPNSTGQQLCPHCCGFYINPLFQRRVSLATLMLLSQCQELYYSGFYRKPLLIVQHCCYVITILYTGPSESIHTPWLFPHCCVTA
jgi:hypothetical protein